MIWKIYSKDDCPNCVEAIRLLPDAIVLKLNVDYTREELLALAPGTRSLPLITLNDVLLGDLHSLKTYVKQDTSKRHGSLVNELGLVLPE